MNSDNCFRSSDHLDRLGSIWLMKGRGVCEFSNTLECSQEQVILNYIANKSASTIRREIENVNSLIHVKFTTLFLLYVIIAFHYRIFKQNWIIFTGVFIAFFYITLYGVALFRTEWMIQIFGVRKVFVLLLYRPLLTHEVQSYKK